MKKGKNILAVGVAGALLLSITGSVQPLNQAKALSAPQASATNSLDVKNLHDGIYSIDAIIIDAPWLLSNMIDIDKTRLIVKDGQYKVELNTKCFEDVFFVSHIWNLKYVDSGVEKDAQITGWHDTNSPGYEVNTEASRAVEYFRNYPDRYAFPKTIVYPVDKSKIDSKNELNTYIICDCGTYKTQRYIKREKLVLRFATLKPIELDYSKEKVTAKEKIRDLSFLNGEEFNDFNRKIDQAKDEEEIQNLVNQAIAKDNANKEAKTKALEELDKLANLDEKERESFKEKINKTDSVAVANEVLNQAKEKNTANKELKEAKAKALEELGKLANLDEKEKDNLKEEINLAQDKKEINRVLDRAKEKDKTREEIEELANAKENAKAEINKLANLTEEQKEAAKKEIDNTDSKEGVNDALARAKRNDTTNKEEKDKKELEELKTSIKTLIEKLANLADGEKASFNEEIDIADSLEKVNDALARAKEKDKAALAKVKAKVKEEIEKLTNLTKDQKEAAEAKIDKASSIEEVDETRTKVKAKAAIEKFTNLTKEQKDNLKEEIDKADSLEQVKDVFVKAKEKDKANKEAKEAKTKALEELGKLDNLDEKEKDYLKEEINLAQDKKEINRVLDRAKEKNTANKELKDAKEKALAELDKLDSLTNEEKESFKEEINKANSIDEVNYTLDQAKEKNTANKKLKEAQEKAVKTVKELKKLTEVEKTKAVAEINKANSIIEVYEALEKVEALEKDKESLKEAKESALAKLDKLDNLTNEEKESFKELINQTQDKKEVKEVIIQASARNTDNKLLKEAKTRAIAELEKLDSLTNEEKESFKEQINKEETGREVWDILEFAKAKGKDKKAFKQIDTLKNLSEKRKKYYKELISSQFNNEEILRDAIIENRRAGVLKPEITKALEYLSTYKDLPEKHRDYFENVIEIAKNKEEIKKITEGAKFTNDAIKEIKELKYLSYREKSKFIGYTSMFGPGEVIKLNKVKEALKNAKIQDNKNKIRVPQAIEVVENASNLTYDKATEIIEKLNNATTKDEVENILKEAGLELPKESGVAPDVTPTPTPNVTPAPDVTPTPTPEVKAGWKNDEKGYKYQRVDGSFAKAEWEPVDGTWYHFDANGYMQTGWLNLGGTWYYLNDDGSMAKDTWIGTYYVDENGAWVVEGWQNNGYGWWYQRANGTYPNSEWEIINGIWYYFDANGYMLADEATPDGYYVDVNGAWVK